ncbi:PTS mannose transporter subunit IIA [Staphylococcus cohnii]|uniref:BglG family transcription antiterminator n=1 Tax=Staphylococcus cohnii species complex TaxID=3239053 RepID=UPI000D1A8BEB|nr:BglG family transcription antiterminator [Staphylococcus ureilyticus]MBM9448150.1 BglG family transcription antiterminator [Staphylococcus ureilyticus]PTF46542.1 PTS mannose transporter subunit IIA [Staphylococcus cohnii]PTG43045.1 PTS mannose transporter subunit IIA [Staphylococcus cohnii]PUZ35517.1 PRD domain-containing protein [Staphylococcus cohnii]
MLIRHAKLIRLLLNNSNHYLSADEIANYLSVSNRTVRNDIQYINGEIINRLITSVKGKGYKLNHDHYDETELETLIHSYLTKENEKLMKIGYELLMYQKPTTIDQIESAFMVTKAEANDYINRIKAWCASFDINVEVIKKKGVTITGNEMNIRNAILHLNQLSNNEKTVEGLILNEIPQAHIKTICHIIKNRLAQHYIFTSDMRIQQLLIHLVIIIKREKISEDSWVINEEAEEIAMQCIEDINHKLAYGLSKDTAKLFSFFISYYFNKYDLGIETFFVESYVARMIHQMEKIVGINFTQDNILRENIQVHFSRAYLRIAKNVYINNPLTDEIKKYYPFVFNALYETVKYLAKDSNLSLVEDEIAFLALHFQSSIDRNKKDEVNIVITCYYGLGISSLLEVKIANLDSHINIVDTLKLERLSHYNFSNIDMLITTHPIDTADLPNTLHVIEVSPLLSDNDINHIKSFINNKRNPVLKQDEISAIQFDVQTMTDEETATHVFENAQSMLMKQHAITESYMKSALEREKFASTYIGNGISMPHGDPAKVLRSHVIIFKCPHGLLWKQNKVKLVFFLAIANSDTSAMKKIIHVIAGLNEYDVDQLMTMDAQHLKQYMIKLIKT